MLSEKSKKIRCAPLALGAMLCCGTAAAQMSDTVHPFVSVGVTYDDNLLRLPDTVPAGTQMSDRATQAQAGFTFDRPISRQRLTGQAKVSRVTFDHFDQLDYNGKDMSIDWAWELGNHLSGNVGTSYVQTLTPFSDFHTDERNLRTQRSKYFNGAWRFHPSWQVRGAVRQSEFDYELQAQRLNNRTEDINEAGVDYLARSGSRFGIVARRLEGKYDNRRVSNSFVLDDNYTQDELKANVVWLLSPMTRVQVLAGYAKRKHPRDGSRDSSGANGRVSVSWAVLDRLTLTSELWREFAAVESVILTNSLNKGASVGATWEVSGKVQATASLRRETREFELASTLPISGDASDRTEGATVGLTWVPRSLVQVGVNAFRDKRTGNRLIGTNDYRAKGVSLNVSLQF